MRMTPLNPPTAKEQLDLQYNEMRWRVLSLAADLDRVQRYLGGQELIDRDTRLKALRECVGELMSDQPGRAERVQTILSDKSPVV